MALDLNLVSFVGSAVKLAWELYDKGFKQEKSSPQRYIDFGVALNGLRSHTTTIKSIIEKANQGLENDRLGGFGPSSYDLSTFKEIVGNFRLTLEECRDLLNDGTKFRQKNGFVTNILYNINVDEHVVHLTERIAFHNIKINLVIDTFSMHFQSQLRTLQQEQHQDTAEILQELKLLVRSKLDIENGHLSPGPARDLKVPAEISRRFAAACARRVTTEGEDDFDIATFPLREGLQAFFHYFDNESPTIDSTSYLRVMKSVWIMERIRESADWDKVQRSNPGGLYDRCVREMDRKLRAKCTKVADSRTPLPELSMILQLPDESFSIWPDITPESSTTSVTHLGTLLDIPILPDPGTHSLRIVRNMDGTLGLEDTIVTTMESSGIVSSERRIQTLNIDPKSAYLVPIYAMPVSAGSNPASLTVKLQSSRDGVNGIAPEFETKNDLLKLQHLMTGYKCVKQRNSITVTSLAEGQDFPNSTTRNTRRFRRASKELHELGNLQLWLKTPYDKSLPASSVANVERRFSAITVTDVDRRLSAATSPTIRNSIQSILSKSPTMSSMSSSHTQHLTLGPSGIGIELKEPTPPLLVLFLKEPDSSLLSFLIVELDERTKMNPFSCKCHNHKKKCTVSVLERSGDPLLARRFYSTGGLNSWNLAAIGEHWPLADNGSVRVQDMHWLSISFGSEDERKKFNKHLGELVSIFAGRLEDYRRDLRRVRGTHIVSQKG